MRLAQLRPLLGLAALGLAALGVASAQTRAHRMTPTVMPGPDRGSGAPERVALNHECVSCHPVAARQWEGSMHQRAFIDEDFSSAYQREPRAVCRGCHAPEGEPSAAPSSEIAALGVACVTCHVPEGSGLPRGGVLAGPIADGHPREPAPHPVRRRAAFAKASACGQCHEFASAASKGLMMQTTLTEHRASAFADMSCQDCHMPRDGQGRRTHGFAASRDPAVLHDAIRARAERTDDRVRVDLRPGAVGHAFPTGDPFRRLVVEVGPLREGEPWLPHDSVILARRLGSSPRGGRVERSDDRLGPAGASVDFVLPTLRSSSLLWRVVYERADLGDPDDEPWLFDRVTVAEGHLPPNQDPVQAPAQDHGR